MSDIFRSDRRLFRGDDTKKFIVTSAVIAFFVFGTAYVAWLICDLFFWAM